jgi:hypothetical protein
VDGRLPYNVGGSVGDRQDAGGGPKGFPFWHVGVGDTDVEAEKGGSDVEKEKGGGGGVGTVGGFLVCPMLNARDRGGFVGDGTVVTVKRQSGEATLIASKVQKDEQLINALTKPGASP